VKEGIGREIAVCSSRLCAMGKSSRLLIAGLTALVIGLPGAAYADAWSGLEPAGDVHGFTFDPEPPPCGTSTDWNATANTTNDITKLVVNHTAERVVLTLRFRDLRRRGAHMTQFAIRTDERGYLLNVDRWKTGAKTESFLAHEPSIPEPDPEAECGGIVILMEDRYCPRLTGQIAPDIDVVKVSIPRRCLSTPRWVQVGAHNYRFEEDGRSFYDRWAPAGSDETSFFGPYGPRVRPS
jgi:hypothetical protein